MNPDAETFDLVLASSNAGKFKEFRKLFAATDRNLVSQDSLGIKAPPETGLTFIENAIEKARHAAAESNTPAIGDDSGLSVVALRGAPGIYSSRYAGCAYDNRQTKAQIDALNNARLLQELTGISRRDAQFHCALAYLRHAEDPVPIIATGNWCGEILTTERGRGGFGYDSLFYVPALKMAAAELSEEEKNRFSHRAIACQNLLTQMLQLGVL